MAGRSRCAPSARDPGECGKPRGSGVSGTPAASRATTASRAFATLNRPGSRTLTATSRPAGPTARNVLPSAASSTSTARQSRVGAGRRDRRDGNCRCPSQQASPLVIDVDDSVPGPGGGEQVRLRCEVVRHRRMEVQMVLAQVGEDSDVVRRPVHPAERQRVRVTSIAAASQPRSSINASRACSSGASGVVRTLGSTSPAMRVSTVPTSPVTRPAARKPASARKTVVVLPLVPVTPSRAGARPDGRTPAPPGRRARDRGSSTTSAGSPAARTSVAPGGP